MVEWRNARRQQPSATAAQRRVDSMHANLGGQGSARKPPLSASPESPERPGEDVGDGATSAESARHLGASLPRRRRLSGAVEDRLPARVQDLTGRVVSGHHVAALAVVLACAVALSAWWLVAGRARPEPVAAPAPAVPLVSGPSVLPEHGPSAVPTAPSADASASSPSTVIVDVAGKVRDPGIVTLPGGSRVVDALKAAGGARESVDLTALNLARELVDGEQLLVGLAPIPGLPQPAPPSGSGTTGPVVLVNLNIATLTELDTLPGVGPVTGQAILDWRAEHGSFTSVDELLEVDGIGEATLADLRDLVSV